MLSSVLNVDFETELTTSTKNYKIDRKASAYGKIKSALNTPLRAVLRLNN